MYPCFANVFSIYNRQYDRLMVTSLLNLMSVGRLVGRSAIISEQGREVRGGVKKKMLVLGGAHPKVAFIFHKYHIDSDKV